MTFNVSDFYELSVQWAQAGKSHSGIVVTNHVGRQAFGPLLHRLLQLHNRMTADEMRNVYLYL